MIADGASCSLYASAGSCSHLLGQKSWAECHGDWIPTRWCALSETSAVHASPPPRVHSFLDSENIPCNPISFPTGLLSSFLSFFLSFPTSGNTRLWIIYQPKHQLAKYPLPSSRHRAVFYDHFTATLYFCLAIGAPHCARGKYASCLFQ